MPTQRPPPFGAYMQFLRLSAPLKSRKDALSVNELALFEEIVLAWSQSQPLSVSQAIGIERLGAHATLFKRLAELRRRPADELASMIEDMIKVLESSVQPSLQRGRYRGFRQGYPCRYRC